MAANKKFCSLAVFSLCLLIGLGSCEKLGNTTKEQDTEREIVIQQTEDPRLKQLEQADVVYVMHAVGFLQNGYGYGSMSVTYFLLENDSVVILADSRLRLPYSKEEARIIMQKEMELQKK